MKETSEARSRIMRAVKGRDTAPKWLCARLAHRMGYRFRVCRKDLPGRPDIVFPRLRKVDFRSRVFLARPRLRARGARPQGKREYWLKKISANRKRDVKHLKSLRAAGWQVLVVWECFIIHKKILNRQVKNFLAE